MSITINTKTDIVTIDRGGCPCCHNLVGVKAPNIDGYLPTKGARAECGDQIIDDSGALQDWTLYWVCQTCGCRWQNGQAVKDGNAAPDPDWREKLLPCKCGAGTLRVEDDGCMIRIECGTCQANTVGPSVEREIAGRMWNDYQRAPAYRWKTFGAWFAHEYGDDINGTGVPRMVTLAWESAREKQT